MTWTEVLIQIVLPVVIALAIPIGGYVFSKLNNHGERLVRIETRMGTLAPDVRAIKKETKTQTKLLYHVLGRLGVSIAGDDEEDDDEPEDEADSPVTPE